jgi:hypothetical protein
VEQQVALHAGRVLAQHDLDVGRRARSRRTASTIAPLGWAEVKAGTAHVTKAANMDAGDGSSADERPGRGQAQGDPHEDKGCGVREEREAAADALGHPRRRNVRGDVRCEGDGTPRQQ